MQMLRFYAQSSGFSFVNIMLFSFLALSNPLINVCSSMRTWGRLLEDRLDVNNPIVYLLSRLQMDDETGL